MNGGFNQLFQNNARHGKLLLKLQLLIAYRSPLISGKHSVEEYECILMNLCCSLYMYSYNSNDE